MAKAARAVCDRCEQRLNSGTPYCGNCGHPTAWATHDDRVAWELHQYRDQSEKNPMGVLYDPSSVKTMVIEKPKSRKLFGRRTAHRAPVVAPAPKPAEPVAPPILRAVEPVPVRELPERPKAAKPAAPRPKPAKIDKEPLRDTPATVLAVRMLNNRVAELDATIQKLQHEIEMLRRS
jgi:ribosomal protein S27AE